MENERGGNWIRYKFHVSKTPTGEKLRPANESLPAIRILCLGLIVFGSLLKANYIMRLQT